MSCPGCWSEVLITPSGLRLSSSNRLLLTQTRFSRHLSSSFNILFQTNLQRKSQPSSLPNVMFLSLSLQEFLEKRHLLTIHSSLPFSSILAPEPLGTCQPHLPCPLRTICWHWLLAYQSSLLPWPRLGWVSFQVLGPLPASLVNPSASAFFLFVFFF